MSESTPGRGDAGSGNQDAVGVNLQNWDERVADHLIAYEAAQFADDPESLSAEVEAHLLAPYVNGSFVGVDLLHLQCHIGLDTISFARRGARVVGTDLSPAAIDAARRLAARAGAEAATFVCCSNEDAPAVLSRSFDVVFTSVGVLPWLPDLASWARAIHQLLRPGGVFLVYDAHPLLNALDDEPVERGLIVGRSYFHGAVPTRYDDGTTYASDSVMTNSVTYEWTHDLGEIIGSLLDAGLRVESFAEHSRMPWKALASMVECDGDWVLAPGTPAVPLMFSLVASRP